MTNLKDLNGFKMIAGTPCIDPRKIKVIEHYNVRDTFDQTRGLDEKGKLTGDNTSDAALFASMMANGFIMDKPLTVRIVGKDCFVISGHRRLAAVLAAIKAGKNIPGAAIIPEALDDAGFPRDNAEMAYDIALSNNGQGLSASEKGLLILRLRGFGEPDATIATRLGIGAKWLRDLASLAKSDPRMKALLKADIIPPTTAVLLERSHGKTTGADIGEAAAKLAKEAGKAKANAKDIAMAETLVTGQAPKLGTAGRKAAGNAPAPAGTRETAPAKPPAVTVLAEKPHVMPKPSPVAGLAEIVNGPFNLGTKEFSTTLYDAAGLEVCTFADDKKAQAFARIIAQGLHTLCGIGAVAKPVETKAPPVKAEPARVSIPTGKAAKAAQAKEAARLAEIDAKRAAAAERIAAQLAKVEGERIAREAAAAAEREEKIAAERAARLAKAGKAKAPPAAKPAEAPAKPAKAKPVRVNGMAGLASAIASKAKAGEAGEASRA